MTDIYQKAASLGKDRGTIENLIRLFGAQRAENIVDDLARAQQQKAVRSTATAISPQAVQALGAQGVAVKQLNAAYEVYGPQVGKQVTADLLSRDGARQRRGRQLTDRASKAVMRQVPPEEIDAMAETMGISQEVLGALMLEFGADRLTSVLVKLTADKAYGHDHFWGMKL